MASAYSSKSSTTQGKSWTRTTSSSPRQFDSPRGLGQLWSKNSESLPRHLRRTADIFKVQTAIVTIGNSPGRRRKAGANHRSEDPRDGSKMETLWQFYHNEEKGGPSGNSFPCVKSTNLKVDQKRLGPYANLQSISRRKSHTQNMKPRNHLLTKWRIYMVIALELLDLGISRLSKGKTSCRITGVECDRFYKRSASVDRPRTESHHRPTIPEDGHGRGRHGLSTLPGPENELLYSNFPWRCGIESKDFT